LNKLGFRQSQDRSVSERNVWNVPKKRFVRAVSELIDRGWRVEAQGRSYRTAGSVEVTVSSGQDWFDIGGLASFGEATLPFPELLRAIRGGERFVMLDDGTYGLIPEEWAERYGGLAAKFNTKEGVLRFRSNQTVLLDLLLDEMPEVSYDERFIGARQKLDSFSGVTPQAPPPTFKGELRPYQQIALGWFSFLRDFGLGGCLADDMGLGKTVQVLALLEDRRLLKIGRPSLAIVPKSLIFNWMREAERFTPKLRTLDYTGILRSEFAGRFDAYDLVLTTYGTLRRDIAELREIQFDYVILDESQAIKNPLSATAKASRLLQGDHRIAMSGTPIENRIEELWSLFEFLNPGMLGSSKAFTRLMEPQTEEEILHSGRRTAKIGQVLRPFILRRTKQAVAPELPERVEQTIFCELGGTQRRLYNELLDFIRNQVMGEVIGNGIGKSSLIILEGLLRLRQAASHPGLLDPKRRSAGCAKFDVLIPRLSELAAEGHKVLVFSQFTSLLDILKGELVEEGLTFEYLDGKTRDRQACVDRFQNSPEIPLFLISLKAGGVGLNLTAASYVYLLDPWWNPAVEAQAIDRTHRIGQKNTVVASRLIARDTIEEKVLALQQKKRDLADSIITGENSLIRDLSREDLEMLLG
jgi:SNF2 family DNA or RNA helicase